MRFRQPHGNFRNLKLPGVKIVGPMIIGALVLAMLLACDSGQTDPSGHGDGFALYPKLPHVTGHIDRVDPNPENLRHFSLLQVTDADRQQWEFRADGWVGVSAGHLKDHQIQGTTVTIWYQDQGDGTLLARFVSD
ncbi:MAG: hypothetical protein OXE87_15230 [Chloroflexi bacterium]|nr:hypothetical protein [Chloroflexota bacterium]